MRIPQLIAAAIAFALAMITPEAFAQSTTVTMTFDKPEARTQLKFPVNTVLRAERVLDVPALVAGQPVSVDKSYAFLKYQMGDNNDQYLRQMLDHLEEYLVSKFGNQVGTFALIVRIKGDGGKLDIKQPILTMQWDHQRILFKDKVVKDATTRKVSGWVLDELRLTDQFNKLEVGLESYFKNNASIDFSVFQTLGKLVNTSQLSAVIPLSAPTLAVIDSVGGIFKLFFDETKDITRSDTRDVKFIEANAASATRETFPFTFTKNGTDVLMKVRIHLDFTLTTTKYGEAFKDGKFDQTKLSAAIIEKVSFRIGDKDVAFLDLLAQSANESDKALKPFLTAIRGEKDYKEADTEDPCRTLYGAFNRYFSEADARAMFWAFVITYGHHFDRMKCLGGNRKEELGLVGLTIK